MEFDVVLRVQCDLPSLGRVSHHGGAAVVAECSLLAIWLLNVSYKKTVRLGSGFPHKGTACVFTDFRMHGGSLIEI